MQIEAITQFPLSLLGGNLIPYLTLRIKLLRVFQLNFINKMEFQSDCFAF